MSLIIVRSVSRSFDSAIALLVSFILYKVYEFSSHEGTLVQSSNSSSGIWLYTEKMLYA